MRTVFFDHTDLASAGDAEEEIERHLRTGLEGSVDSPVATSVSLQKLEQGTSTEQTLGQLVERVGELARAVGDLGNRIIYGSPGPTDLLLAELTSGAHPPPTDWGLWDSWLERTRRLGGHEDAATKHLRRLVAAYMRAAAETAERANEPPEAPKDETSPGT